VDVVHPGEILEDGRQLVMEHLGTVLNFAHVELPNALHGPPAWRRDKNAPEAA
jgi:hypothetical protein